MAAKKLSEITQGIPQAGDFVVGVTSTNQDRLFPAGTTSSNITVNTTAIIGGTNLAVLYDNAGTVGEAAQFSIISGQPNVTANNYYMYGGNAFLSAISSQDCVFLGLSTGNFTMTGVSNVGVGLGTMQNLTTGNSNVALGVSTLSSATTATANFALGPSALAANIDGNNNVAIGKGALAAIVHTSRATAIGSGVMEIATSATACLGIGNQAMQHASVIADCVAIGDTAMTQITTGIQNTGIGSAALQDLTTGQQNTAIGFDSGRGITSGSFNTIIGAVVTGLASGLSNAIIIADGSGTIRFDYNQTSSGHVTLDAAGLNLSLISSAAATVAANFVADHRLQVTIGGVTYYIAMSTTAW